MHNAEVPEKRRFARFLISIPLKYARASIKEISDVKVNDISAEGISLITAEELPVKSPLNICLVIPDNGEEVALDAEVVWSKCNGNGHYRSGLRLNSAIKPIPLVLRALNSRF